MIKFLKIAFLSDISLEKYNIKPCAMTVAYTETETGSGYVVCKHVYKPTSSILAASLNHVVESLVLETAKI